MSNKVLSLSILISATFIAGFLLIRKETPSIVVDARKEIPLSDIAKVDDSTFITEENPSEGAVKIIAEQLQKANPKGPQPLASAEGKTAIKTTDPKTVANMILAEEASKATESLLNISIPDSEVIVKNSASSTAYFVARKEILETANKALLPYANQKDFSEASLRALSSETRIAYIAMQKLAVPPALAEIQRQQLKALKMQWQIFGKITDYEQDPVSATTAISLIPKIEEEDALLTKMIKDYFAKV